MSFNQRKFRKDIGEPNNTNNGEDRSYPENRIKFFNKEFDYRATIYKCNNCGVERKYGHGAPERTMVLITCEGTCHKHTWHSYVVVIGGRGRINYAGISNNP